MRAALLLLFALACGSQPPRAPQNIPDAARPPVAIAPDQALGWIGFAPLPVRDPGNWIPAGTQAVLVPMPAENLATGATLSAIDVAGRVARVKAGEPTKVPYGCDDNQLDVLPFTGEKLAPGAVWLLPPEAPASWSPRALAIRSPVTATEVRRRDTVGPLSLELDRTDPKHGTLKIVRDGRTIHTIAIVRGGEMEGGEPAPLDFRHSGISIPEPVAAWSIGDGGPILLVLLTPSYEGLHLKPLLVERDGARELEEMAMYLYRCAF